MRDLFAAAVHSREARGTHGAALSDGQELLVVAEDVGRHNAVDKVKGEALLRGIPTEDRLLLSTGRVSSEMLLKAARMGVPLVASRTSPTEMAVALAEQLNITVCGYVRGDGMNLYAGGARGGAPGAPPRRKTTPSRRASGAGSGSAGATTTRSSSSRRPAPAWPTWRGSTGSCSSSAASTTRS